MIKVQCKNFGISLPYDRCENCLIKQYNIKYEGLAKDVSWGNYEKFIDLILINDKGVDYNKILGGRDGDVLREIILKYDIKNYLVTANTLCRPSQGQSPDLDTINSCYNNIEHILQTVIRTNIDNGHPPPRILLLGAQTKKRFFSDKKFLKTSLRSTTGKAFFDSRYPGCPIFITNNLSSVFSPHNGGALEMITMDILSAIKYKSDTEIREDNYLMVENLEEFNNIINYLSNAKYLVYDIETTGTRYVPMKNIIEKKKKINGKFITERTESWRQDVIIGISLSKVRNEGIYLPLWVRGKDYDKDRFSKYHKDREFDPDNFYFWLGEEHKDYVINKLKQLIEDPNIKIGNQNIKFDNAFLIAQLGIYPNNVTMDTMLASFLLDENSPNSLEHNVDIRYMDLRGYKQRVSNKVSKKAQDEENYSDISLDNMALYGAKDADATQRLSEDLLTEIDEAKNKALIDNPNSMFNPQWLLENLYIPLQEVYLRAEMVGIKFDIDYAKALSINYEEICNSFNDYTDIIAEEHINLNSPKQKQQFFFKKLGWPIFKNSKTKKLEALIPENASTDKDHIKLIRERLEKLNKKGDMDTHLEFIEGLLDYTNKKKMISTYLRGKKLLNRLDKNNRLHYSMKLHSVVSQRLSSTPNVQNLPRDPKIRGIFIPGDGYKLASCDLAQVELRIMADYANDEVMIDWINKGIDVHWVACLDVFYRGQNLKYDSTNPEMKRYRKLTKLCNFGGLYGGSDKKKVQSVNEKLKRGEEKITIQIAKTHTEWFNSTFKRIHQYLKEVEAQILKFGYIDNIFGGRRRLPEAFHEESYIRAEAVRQGANAQIQGTASHICQFGFIRLDKWFRENNMKSRVLWTVHDEVDFEVHKSEIDIVKKNVVKLMTSKEYPIDRIKVKLGADLSIYKHGWGGIEI